MIIKILLKSKCFNPFLLFQKFKKYSPHVVLELTLSFVTDAESESFLWGPSGNATGSKFSCGGGPSSGIVGRAELPWYVSYLGL